MLRHSPYALDFYTAVLLFSTRDGLTEGEIEKELDKHTRPLGFKGPCVKTILRWLSRFHKDAKTYTSFFTQKLSEHHFDIPLILPPDKRAAYSDYASVYFLECISALYAQLHPKEKQSFNLLWYANTLLLRQGKRGLFASRRPP